MISTQGPLNYHFPFNMKILLYIQTKNDIYLKSFNPYLLKKQQVTVFLN